ncbi:MAG TPA: GNAT family N-acetyltransferase [Rhizobiaceae bacterium]|nr:GNAT family N-acetyltransferase [Rhizobiaceae bacterium]
MVKIAQIEAGFDRWEGLLDLIRASFAYMDGVIDPPSSAHRLTIDSLAKKTVSEIGFIAWRGDQLAGCVFLAEKADRFYLGKLAIAPELQRAGIGRVLLVAAEAHAKDHGKPVIELQTRVELTGNHAAFARLGFQETGRTAHPGFDRSTSVTMRKVLS